MYLRYPGYLRYLTLFLFPIIQVSAACQNGDCGWKGLCVNDTCECPANYSLHWNQYDCVKNGCFQDGCLECSPQMKCVRCTNFIDELTMGCLDKCIGETKVVNEGPLLGNVCKQTGSSDSTDLIIGVVCGVAGGVLLCLIVTFMFCCHYKHTRKKINLQQKKYKSQNMQLGKLTQIPVFDNKGYENDVIGSSDYREYFKELDKLQQHGSALLSILNDIRSRLRCMDSNDPRIPTYRGVVHQLCRVLVLLNKTEPSTSVPSDAPGLLQWAQQMLDDYQMDSYDHLESGKSIETPISKISYIDVPVEHRKSHQYAIPQINNMKEERNPTHHHHSQQSSLSHNSDTGYYSSTPVPVEYRSSTLPNNRISSSFETFTSEKKNKRNHDPRRFSSFSNITQCPKDSCIGYFANGRYYDPSPKPEIYAPASSYSEIGNKVMSTFLSDDHQEACSHSSADSSMYVDAEENTFNDLDSCAEETLPFSPEEATDPVEV